MDISIVDSRAFATYSKMATRRGITGAEVAEMILKNNGIHDVRIEPIGGNLTDHYDPRTKVVRLSESVYSGTSIAAAGVAAHEVGHAIQHQKKYVPIQIRNTIVPVAQIASYAAIPLFFIGMIASLPVLVNIGIFVFAGVVVFHVITLPVELNASSRALVTLRNYSILEPEELVGARKMLNAAAMTYMAAALMAIVNLLRLILISRRN